MPCYSPPMHKDEHGNWLDGEIPQATFDKLVRLLCESNKIIDAMRGDPPTRSPELEKWWKNHQEFDRRRGGK